MQNDPATAGASESGHSDLVDVTLNDGKYTIRQVPGGRWECLRYGEPWPAFEGRQPDNLHTALAYEVDHLRQEVAGRLTAGLDSTLACDVEQLSDRVEGLSSDLDAAVEVAFRHGATDWVRLNYPTHFERLSAAAPSSDVSMTIAAAAAALVAAIDSEPRSTWAPNAGRPTWERNIYGPAVRALKLALESRESAPAPGAEATAGTDAGGTAARNMFAAHALPALLVAWAGKKTNEEIVAYSYEVADLMVWVAAGHGSPQPNSSTLEREREIEHLIQFLLARGADKIRVINDFPNRCGLDIPMNDVDDGEMFSVAELSHEDSGYAPALWQLAIAVLQSRRAAVEKQS